MATGRGESAMQTTPAIRSASFAASSSRWDSRGCWARPCRSSWRCGRAAAASPAVEGEAGVGPTPRAKSVILVFLTGGLSHIDSFDMKPDAPDGIRGEFRPIETAVPGIHYCEHLPRLAARADKLAVVRSLSHAYTNHLNATHEILTGHPQPGAFFDKIASRDDYPCYASAVDAIRPRADGIPSGMTLPTFLMEGPLDLAGPACGVPRAAARPLAGQAGSQPARVRLRRPDAPGGLSVERLDRRKSLLDQ